MAALDFPSSPTVGQQYPTPAVPGLPVYNWDGTKWIGAFGISGYVMRTGDRMTGALRAGAVQAAPPLASSVSAGSMSCDISHGFNAFVNAAGSNWLAQATGFGAMTSVNPADGSLAFLASSASVVAGASFTMVPTMTILANGTVQPKAVSVVATVDNYNMLSLNNGAHFFGIGIVGGFANFNDNGGNGFNFTSSGTSVASIRIGGGMNIPQPPTSTNTAISAQGPTGTYAGDFRSNCSAGVAAVIGWGYGTTQYGQVGNMTSGTNYSFYGSCVAFLATGSWSVSDVRVKTLVKELDPASALMAVNALKVHEFKPSTPAAAEMFYGRQDIPDETLYGWSAQEIEKIIPIAVKDIPIPAVDRNMRAAVRNIDIPVLDSKEAETLGAEDITIKAVHDRYMLTTLWAAVQHLSAQNAAMAVEIQALKAAP